MLAAGLGALIAMLVFFFINMRYQKDFWKELKESFKIKDGDRPLGEVRLREMIKDARRE